MIMKALGILVLAIGFVQAEQKAEPPKNIFRILLEFTKNPNCSDRCWRLNEDFPNQEFPENHVTDQLGLKIHVVKKILTRVLLSLNLNNEQNCQRKVWMKKPFIACASCTKAYLI